MLVVRIELVGAPLVSTSVHISLSAASPAKHFLLPRGSLVFIMFINVFAAVATDICASRMGLALSPASISRRKRFEKVPAAGTVHFLLQGVKKHREIKGLYRARFARYKCMNFHVFLDARG